MPTYDLDPVGRIEGHLGIEISDNFSPSGLVDTDSGYCKGTMYRGFENIMMDRQPQEGIQITQRI